MTDYAFKQVDVFTTKAFSGNPLAVVLGADALSAAQMAAFARWTNLSETTFLLKPEAAGADYRVRIFTPVRELPFAGHPTLGSCHAWLEAGGRPRGAEIVQECGVGLVSIRRDGDALAFAAPPLRRSGPVDDGTVAQIARSLRLTPERIQAAQWVDNGPGWVAVMLGSRVELLAVRPDFAAMAGLTLGVVAPWDPATDGAECQFEVRAFVPDESVPEDPVTGSLNAGLAQWLIGAGRAPPAYVACQGTAIGRAGRIEIKQIGADIWVGGRSMTRIDGRAAI
ncbi:phenazine biosynthesis protein PhzF [Aliidongia dinghuensis]|uniref:Phenazine biosynthesis protein PhzF n=1 Tax=Aliidongia dinghuensis TaxID=1867774 RepID=A0A8J2YZE6_9PROT|nr:PhzF family phenazine biosynthesis protein [Aliidongia dinghuensis]GGF37046.1 phenazine biosynthesis protein PhzF [Aliidongia dinghuensis]